MKENRKTNYIIEDMKVNVKIKLAAVWAAIMVLYIYNDFFSLFTPGAIEEMISGNMGPFPVTQISLLSASILMAVPAIMIILSLIVKSGLNRWLNIITGVLYTFVGVANLIGETWAFYIISGIITTILTILIIFIAWKWPKSKA